VIHLQLPAALAALLAGIGVYGVLARRNAVLVLIGVELILNAANLLLVTAGSRPGAPFSAGPVLTLFVITIAAAEICVALAVVLVLFRTTGSIDLTAVPDLTDEPEPRPDSGPQPASPPEPQLEGEVLS
jgi:NADH-quinone oxidoreductase subunit K